MQPSGMHYKRIVKGIMLKFVMALFIAMFLLAGEISLVNAGVTDSQTLEQAAAQSSAESSEEDLAESNVNKSSQQLSEKIQQLKNEVLELNSDLFILEEDLLFSANTQISVFVSIDVDGLFALDSVQLKLDDKIVSNYLYTKREVDSLNRGGIQRLYIGNLTSGNHQLTAFFIGKGPSNRNYKRATSKIIDKTGSAKFVELKITGNKSKEQPEFSVKVWE